MVGEHSLTAPTCQLGTSVRDHDGPILTPLVDPVEDIDQLAPLVDEWWLKVTASWSLVIRHKLSQQHQLPWDSLRAEVLARYSATTKYDKYDNAGVALGINRRWPLPRTCGLWIWKNGSAETVWDSPLVAAHALATRKIETLSSGSS